MLAALEDPGYTWRTVKGIAKQSGLTQEQVHAALGTLLDRRVVVQSEIPSAKGDDLYATASRLARSPLWRGVLRWAASLILMGVFLFVIMRLGLQEKSPAYWGMSLALLTIPPIIYTFLFVRRRLSHIRGESSFRIKIGDEYLDVKSGASRREIREQLSKKLSHGKKT